MRHRSGGFHHVSKVIKSAFFSAALLLSNINDANAVLNPETKIKISEDKKPAHARPRKTRASCMIRGMDVVHRNPDGETKAMRGVVDEKAGRLVCRGNSVLVLTKKRLFVLDFSKKPEGFSINTESISAKGIAATTYSKGRFFILTKTRELFAIPLSKKGKDAVLSLPFPTEKAKMKYHGGFLFISAGRRLLIAAPEDEFKFRMIRLPHTPDGSFSVSKDSVVLGDMKITVKSLRNIRID